MPEHAPNAVVKLAPPREPLPETYWQKHRWEFMGGGAGILILAVVCILLARRKKAPIAVPPIVQARRELDALRTRADAVLPVETARVVRRFVLRQIGLPPDELTTAEISRILQRQNRITPEFAALIDEFLRRCDVLKFAPEAGAAPVDLIAEATQLVNRVAVSETSAPSKA